MAIETTVVGAYPKPPEEGGTFALRKTLHAVERGDATPEDLQAAREDLVRAVIAEQEAAGIDLVTDGHVYWDDIVTPFARHMSGFEIGGLIRFFDNNVYYRRPVCTGPVEWRGPSSVAQWQFASSVASVPVKAVIPGPVTFARLSVDEHYGDHESFVTAIASVLAQEAAELVAAGARHLQVDEPSLLDAPEDLPLARRALETIAAEASGAEITLATYFGDAKRLGAELFSLPADAFGLDLVSGPESRNLVTDLPRGKKLQAGIVDARNTKLEDTQALVVEIGTLAEQVGADNLRGSPSASLEFLPREKARAKLQRLSEAVEKARNAS
ncbi:MAG TPA: methylcobamide--CoM methyltransferase [Actinomycetota bacterium]|nr:methylcobamide--CoM methyltransferase [Actinomycetota bacterium]